MAPGTASTTDNIALSHSCENLEYLELDLKLFAAVVDLSVNTITLQNLMTLGLYHLMNCLKPAEAAETGAQVAQGKSCAIYRGRQNVSIHQLLHMHWMHDTGHISGNIHIIHNAVSL